MSFDRAAMENRKQMKRTIWISYDLGVKGDYEGLYAWLDNHGARECGNNVATFPYHFQENAIEELKDDLLGSVDLDKHDRIYVIWRENGKMKGQFLSGKRKAAPWSGYGSQEPEIDEEEE